MIEHRVLKKVKANEKNFFPNWGAAAPFVGIIFGAFCGGGIGIYFDIAFIGIIVGSAVGISAGMVLLAAAVVVASSRSKN
ncbi:MAG: hypothetical protein CMM56_03655 [Rhodospirillaceae bacterium]|nr:hypothetical protein [Rhodospirillaceae bacterium]